MRLQPPLEHFRVVDAGRLELRIGDASFRVYDSHDDTMYYDGGMLTTKFRDIDGDGYLDLALSGIVLFTGEKDEGGQGGHFGRKVIVGSTFAANGCKG